MDSNEDNSTTGKDKEKPPVLLLRVCSCVYWYAHMCSSMACCPLLCGASVFALCCHHKTTLIKANYSTAESEQMHHTPLITGNPAFNIL